MKLPRTCLVIATIVMFIPAEWTAADITDFTNWHLLQAPSDPAFTTMATPAQATLSAANSPVNPGTLIGYTSIDGTTAASSTAGYVFDIDADFTIAIDFNVSFNAANGALVFVFGVGENRNGSNSAGALFVTDDGIIFPFIPNYQGVAVSAGVQAPLQDTGLAATLNGSLFVEYDATSGDVTLGASNVPGAGTPAGTTTFAGVQNEWTDKPLLASFFMRSEAITIFAPNGWAGGEATAAFSNFRVLEGQARAIPEPGSFCLTGLLALTLLSRHRRRR